MASTYHGVCPCHGVPVYANGRQRYCAVKRRLANLAAGRRYRATAKGAANVLKQRQRRILIGHTIYGRAATVEQAAVINRHIKERLLGFKQGQSHGEETQVVAAREVRPQTALRPNRL